MTKEHLEGRASALGEVVATLDERLAKGCGSWAYELRQELARVKGNCERMAEKSTPDYERRKAYEEGWSAGWDRGYDRGRSEAQAYSQYIQANAYRMREGWQPVCFDEFMESEFLVDD